MSRTKIGVFTLISLFLLVFYSRGVSRTVDAINLNDLFGLTPYQRGLEERITPKLEGFPGEIGIYVENLDQGKKEVYQKNTQTEFLSASLYKLVLMAAVYDQIEKGLIKENDILRNSKSYLDSRLGGSEEGYAGRPAMIEYSVDEALTEIGRLSDNYAAVLLTDKLSKKEDLQQMADNLEMKDTKFKEEGITTTPNDIATYLRLLYQKKIVSESASEKIIEKLAASELNNRIPAMIPKEVKIAHEDGSSETIPLKIAHKTGELARVRHDAGIVYLDKKPYLIVLMSKDLKFEDTAILKEAEISKAVFDYFTSKER